MENIYKINELQFWQQQEDSVLFDEQAAHLSTPTPSMPLCGWLTVTLDCRSTLGVSNTERVKWTSQVVRDCPPRNAELYFNLKYQTPSLPTSLQRWGNSHFYPLISLELALGERRRFLWSTVLGFQVIQALGKSERGHLIFFLFSSLVLFRSPRPFIGFYQECLAESIWPPSLKTLNRKPQMFSSAASQRWSWRP